MIIKTAWCIAALAWFAASPVLAEEAGCGASPCPAGPWLSMQGEWMFSSAIARWTVVVDESGRFRAEATRSVVIGRENATYRSTLSGTVSHDRVALSIAASDFSLPNFVPGPATICTGVPAGAGRYEGSCANGAQRMRFAFSRN